MHRFKNYYFVVPVFIFAVLLLVELTRNYDFLPNAPLTIQREPRQYLPTTGSDSSSQANFSLTYPSIPSVLSSVSTISKVSTVSSASWKYDSDSLSSEVDLSLWPNPIQFQLYTQPILFDSLIDLSSSVELPYCTSEEASQLDSGSWNCVSQNKTSKNHNSLSSPSLQKPDSIPISQVTLAPDIMSAFRSDFHCFYRSQSCSFRSISSSSLYNCISNNRIYLFGDSLIREHLMRPLMEVSGVKQKNSDGWHRSIGLSVPSPMNLTLIYYWYNYFVPKADVPTPVDFELFVLLSDPHIPLPIAVAGSVGRWLWGECYIDRKLESCDTQLYKNTLEKWLEQYQTALKSRRESCLRLNPIDCNYIDPLLVWFGLVQLQADRSHWNKVQLDWYSAKRLVLSEWNRVTHQTLLSSGIDPNRFVYVATENLFDTAAVTQTKDRSHGSVGVIGFQYLQILYHYVCF